MLQLLPLIIGQEGGNVAKKKIGAYITLDGEKEFRSAVTSCNKSLSTMKSEMKLVEAETAGNANSIDTLRKKNEVLTRTLEEQVKKEEALRRGLAHAQDDYARVGKELQEYKSQLEQSQRALEEMRQSSDVSEEALIRQQDAVDALSKKVEKGEETYRRAGSRVQDWQKQLNNAQAQTIRVTKAVNENSVYMKEAEEATDGCARSIDQFGKKTDDLAEKVTSTGKIIKANLVNTAMDAAKNLTFDVFKSAIQGTIELQDAQQQLRASTGATAQETAKYSKEMQSLYSSGYGDAMGDVANSMSLVRQYTNETDPSKIKELAENGMALEDIFSMDLGESIRGIDALMENMGLSGEQAFDLIAKGTQNGLNKSGELMDNLTEYSSLWSQAGFSAEEMFTILQNGLDSGAYNLDKVNDYVKEFGNSLADGRIDDNINAFSDGTKELVKQWHDGGATTKQVFQSVINDLSNMANQQQALTIASNTWSSLGEDNAMKVITSLNNVNNTYKNVQGTMEEVKKIKYDSVANQWKVLGRTFQTDVMQPILVKFLPAAQKGMKAFADNIDVIAPIASVAGAAVGTIFVVNKSKKFISEVKEAGENVVDFGVKVLELVGIRTAETAAESASTVAKEAQAVATVAQTTATTAQTVATETATVAQTGLNAAMLANPAVLAVAGITALVGVTAVLASGMEEATERTDELGTKTQELQEKVKAASEELKTSTEEMALSLEEVTASGTLAKNLTDELYRLENQSSRTAEEQNRMSTIVMELNTMFPEMSLKIDETTGKLNMGASEMENYIESALEMQKVQVVQEKMKENVEKLVDAEIAKAEAEKNIKGINEELEAIERKRAEATEILSETTWKAQGAQESYGDSLKKGKDNADSLYGIMRNQSDATMEYNGKIMTVTEALAKMAMEEENLNNAKEEAEAGQDELNKTIAAANDEMEPYTNYLTGMTEATNSNTEAIHSNTDAKNEAADQSAVSIEMAGQELEAYDSLSSAQQNMAVNVTNGVLSMQESVQGALQSQMDMFEAFDAGTQISTETLLANMQSQVDGVVAWEQNLSLLADRGINQGILQKLADMGPRGSGYVTAFNSMTDEELSKANELWSQSLDIQSMTDEWGQQLLTSGAANIAGGMANLTPIMEESGANTVMGLVNGMSMAQSQAETAGRDLGIKTVESVNTALGCHSPSSKTRESGKNVSLGLSQGMQNERAAVKQAAMELSEAAIDPIRKTLTVNRTVQYGYNISVGLARGIEQGRSLVIRAASKVAGDAIRAANSTLEINSPSRAFWRMGEFAMQGLAKGFNENSDIASRAVRSAVDYSGINAKIGKENRYEDAQRYGALKQAIKEGVSQVQLKVFLGRRDVTRELSDWGFVLNAQI